MSSTDDVLTAACEVATVLVPVAYRDPACCVAAARLATDALPAFGLRVVPRQAVAVLFNTEYAAYTHLPPAERDARLRAEVRGGARTRGGPWRVDLGPADAGPQVGHVVAEVTAPGDPRRWVLDLSLAQAARPAKGIEAAPFCGPIPEGYTWAGDRHFGFDLPGWHLAYSGDPLGRRSWLGHKDWPGTAVHRKIAGVYVRAIRARLTGAALGSIAASLQRAS